MKDRLNQRGHGLGKGLGQFYMVAGVVILVIGSGLVYGLIKLVQWLW